MQVTYDHMQSDDDWREANFDDDTLAMAWQSQAHGSPTPKELIDAAERFGPEGILEAAIPLGQAAYKRVAEAIAKFEKPAPVRLNPRRAKCV